MPTTFGVEIEIICPDRSQLQVAEAIRTAAGLACNAAGYTHQGNDAWKVVHDGSLGLGGHEVVSPILTLERMGEIDRVCAALAGIRATVNRSCGLHIHVGARSLGVNAMKRLAALYAEGEEIIDKLLPPSRRANNNLYIRSVKNLVANDLARATDAAGIARTINGGERHSKLNFTAFWRHGTVEFRQHSGTTDPAKIRNWILLCLKMVETAAREENEWAAAPVVRESTVSPARSATNPYWRGGRRTRNIFNLISRPQGATAEEIRQVMNLRTRPDVRWHLERAAEVGPAVYSTSRSRLRGGVVFTLRVEGGPPPTTQRVVVSPGPQLHPLTTLDAFLDKLQVSGVERTYWVERAAMLSAAHEA